MNASDDLAKRSVLILDRNSGSSATLKKHFLQGGYRVFTAGTLNEALQVVGKECLAAILLALGSSTEMNHEFVISSLQGSTGHEKVPVVVLLESFSEDLAAAALKAGAADFLVRPIDAKELLGRVGVLIRLNEDGREIAEHLSMWERQFDSSDVGLFFTGKDGELIDCNEALVKMLGYGAKDELLQRNVEKTLYLNPEERKVFRRAIEQKDTIKDFRVTFRRKDGEPVSVLISGRVVRDEKGAVVGYRGKNVLLKTVEPTRRRKGLLAFLPKLPEPLLSLFSASELLGNQYEKIERLGIGSFGEVWKIRKPDMIYPEFYVAKIPLSKKLNAKFEKEADILRKLSGHPGIPEVCEVIVVKNKSVLIQEFVEGKTLQDVIERELEEAEAESVFVQLVDVVAHAHKMGVIHRDIKPGNIIVRPDGTLKLLDFGAAKELRGKEISSTVTGSRPFMSPEQIMGKSQRRSDVWALGVVMYVLYTGMYPFYHSVEKVLMDMILELPVPPPSKSNPDLDPKVERIIMHCLEKKPEKRLPDAGALKKALKVDIPGYGKRILSLY